MRNVVPLIVVAWPPEGSSKYYEMQFLWCRNKSHTPREDMFEDYQFNLELENQQLVCSVF